MHKQPTEVIRKMGILCLDLCLYFPNQMLTVYPQELDDLFQT